MEFTLFYKGKVLSPRAKNVSTLLRVHSIRQQFHRQLMVLWELPPLCFHKDWLKNGSKLKTQYKDEEFIFLVTKKLDMYVKLYIQVLVYPKDRTFKDIDNKLKTICDALRVPAPSELPDGWKPRKDEKPFFCLLKDDEYIYQIAVDTDFLLCPPDDMKSGQGGNDESIWIINVEIKGNRFDDEYKDLLV